MAFFIDCLIFYDNISNIIKIVRIPLMYNIFQKYEISKKTNQYQSIVKKINKINLEKLTDEELKEKALQDLTQHHESDIIVLFATVKEVINRHFGFKVHDEQLLGALSLYHNNIIDMKTGEGKTVVALFPAIMNAKLKKKVHIVTANDYLAVRDYNTTESIFNFFGISVTTIIEKDARAVKREKYKNDVIYTNARVLCFDYLNDSLVKDMNAKIQLGLHVAIIDEIDFVLIEEARSPISISGGTTDTLHSALLFQENIHLFNPDVEFTIDEKSKNIEFNESGFKVLEDLLIANELIKVKTDLYTHENTKFLQTVYQTIRANYTLNIDVDYIVRDDQIVIIDENTGRLSEGKKWIGGLHQAIEIKEGVSVHKDSNTLAASSLQGFFIKYDSFVGMSGTAKNDGIEFKEIYGLDVIEIPTHKKVIRKDFEDLLYYRQSKIIENIIDDVKATLAQGRPILLGTTSVKDSELIYAVLKENNIDCDILNAKNHEREASIIENAGKAGHVTISTNMAGRGTDIMLGGNKDTEVMAFMEAGLSKEDAVVKWKAENQRVNDLGGLHVIGFSRNTSRKIDNQLIGRSGRQGDNGSSRFYLSLEDDLLSVYGKSIEMMFNTLTMGNKEVGIADKRLSKYIMEAQAKNENFLFNARKSLVKYSEITEKQADIIVDMRNSVLKQTNFKTTIENIFRKAVNYIISDLDDIEFIDDKLVALHTELKSYFNLDDDFINTLKEKDIDHVINKTVIHLMDIYGSKRELFEDESLFEKDLILDVIDNAWTEHLTALENMKKGTSFRSFAQKNPLDEFKNESFKMFNFLIRQIFIDSASIIIEFNPIDFIQKIEDNRSNILPTNKTQVNNSFLIANKYGY